MPSRVTLDFLFGKQNFHFLFLLHFGDVTPQVFREISVWHRLRCLLSYASKFKLRKLISLFITCDARVVDGGSAPSLTQALQRPLETRILILRIRGHPSIAASVFR